MSSLIDSCPRARTWRAGGLPLTPGFVLGFVLMAVAGMLSRPVQAFEAFDGQFQAHGFFESQMRTLSGDYGEEWDVAQWYQVFNLEMEFDLAPDGIGPVELLQAYVRAEVRYDCVYSRGCGLFRSMNTWGDRSKSLPKRLSSADDLAYTGAIDRDGVVRRSGTSTNPATLANTNGFDTLARSTNGADGIIGDPAGPLLDDDPFPLVFASFEDYRFTGIDARGGSSDGHPTRTLGPWLPKNFIQTNASLADQEHPLDNSTGSETVFRAGFNTLILQGQTPAAARATAKTFRGGGARNFRAIGIKDAGRPGEGDTKARGLYIPSAPLSARINDIDSFRFNFRESEREWNRGDSQQQTKELKEAYVDMEFLEAQLWLRIGKQSIVWGKTELFRTTDQMNPQDLALASLPSLEESRISLWSFRGVYSFWELGPLQDPRLEVAFNFDKQQPADLGACGEAYTPNLVCELTFGGFAHGTAGIGIAGVESPPNPWNSTKGLEIGGRFEFRWDRYSFAVTDFYGFDDRPYLERINNYERNVDPNTGRPRANGTRGRCTDKNKEDCLVSGPTNRVARDRGFQPNPAFNCTGKNAKNQPGYKTNCLPANNFRAKKANNALGFHHTNQQLFNMICSASIGFSGLDPTACAQSVFGSQEQPLTPLGGPVLAGIPTIAQLLSALIAGAPAANGLQSVVSGSLLPLVQLSNTSKERNQRNGGKKCTDNIYSSNFNIQDPTCGGTGNGVNFFGAGSGLADRLTPQQEALLGCGPFWGVNCDDSGVDLQNMDGSVITQAMPGFDGTLKGWRTDKGLQPGTRRAGRGRFDGGPPCSFGNLVAKKNANSKNRLPGCRGTGDKKGPDRKFRYNQKKDGNPKKVATILDPNTTPTPGAPAGFTLAPLGTAGHPFTGDPWQNEMAAVSWNFMMIAVSQSSKPTQRTAEQSRKSYFNPNKAYKKGRCSYITPQFCSSVQSLFNVTGLQRNTVEAGGDGQFGRRTFVWHSGGESVVRYQKRNVLGFSMDFAEDVTKSNWGIESTWIEGVPTTDNDQIDGISNVDQFNLTVSIDRPTFINFLNDGRTFFLNSQWFFQYVKGYEQGMTTNGPFNVLGTFSFNTGFYQDRLLPTLTMVYDVQSVSGALLPTLTYRYNEAFSVIIGAAAFFGREQLVDMPITPLSPASNRVGSQAYKDSVENVLAAVKDRDEVFIRLRYTF